MEMAKGSGSIVIKRLLETYGAPYFPKRKRKVRASICLPNFKKTKSKRRLIRSVNAIKPPDYSFSEPFSLGCNERKHQEDFLFTLHYPLAYDYFLQYCKRKICGESAECWHIIEDYKILEKFAVEEKLRKDIFEKICQKFFVRGAPCEVNVSSNVVDNTRFVYSHRLVPEIGIFDACQNELFHTMLYDVWPGFVDSEEFKLFNIDIRSAFEMLFWKPRGYLDFLGIGSAQIGLRERIKLKRSSLRTSNEAINHAQLWWMRELGLDFGTYKEERLRKKWPPLFIATSHVVFKKQSKLSTLKKMIELHPESVSATTPEGTTALHIAATAGHAEVVKLLLEAGSNPVCENKFGDTPFSLAKTGRSKSVLRLLVKSLHELAQQL
mmetsp:Transcript_18162/g.20209  ORF Transcript_18162/g.20209 Transcript_18162/m.20209 type:complete len:380 (+) Transcript_18162:136-1275(+)